jgi:pantoate--beta-alanine ligase
MNEPYNWMDFFEDIVPLKNYLKIQLSSKKKIGLIPTMGALHEGHAALIKTAQQKDLCTVATIYVNPAQFNNAADLEKYPRTLEEDKKMLEKLGCDVLFCPPDALMYPRYPPQLQMHFGHLENIMEGKFRKGHFGGVGLVLSKFFHMIRPDVAFFGQKDFQQFMVIKKLVEELFFDIELVMVPTVRNAGGLAFSSRNQRLTLTQQDMARHLYKALKRAQQELLVHKDVSVTKKIIADYFSILSEPEISLEYFEVVDAENFREVNNVSKHRQVALCIAAYISGVRLIDNLLLFS